MGIIIVSSILQWILFDFKHDIVGLAILSLNPQLGKAPLVRIHCPVNHSLE